MALDHPDGQCLNRLLCGSLILVGFAVLFCEGFYFVTDQEFEDELKSGKIIPDVVDKIPEDLLQIEYYNGEEPNLGDDLDAHIVHIAPVVVRWRLAKEDSLHTMLLMDLDVPTTQNPTDRSHVHWMLTNVKGEEFKKTGQTVASYEPVLVPKEDKGKHRLVFLCYKQKDIVNVTEPFDDKDGKPNKKARSKFSHHKFAEKYNFDRLVALNWYYTEHYPNFTYTTVHPDALIIK